jgi:hypothetical protein
VIISRSERKLVAPEFFPPSLDMPKSYPNFHKYFFYILADSVKISIFAYLPVLAA